VQCQDYGLELLMMYDLLQQVQRGLALANVLLYTAQGDNACLERHTELLTDFDLLETDEVLSAEEAFSGTVITS